MIARKISQKGQILVFVILIVFITFFTLFIVGQARVYHQSTNYSVEEEKAISLAEAGIEQAINALNQDTNWNPGPGEKTLEGGQYSIVVTTINSKTKIIDATGYIPSKANPRVKKTVKVTAGEGAGVSFPYAIQVGEGGLTMFNGSYIGGTGADGKGSVYSNGNVIMDEVGTGASAINGDVVVAGGIDPTPDQQFECLSNCVDYDFGTLNDINGTIVLDVAQQVKSTATIDKGYLRKVGLKIRKVGNPPDITIRIFGNKPNNDDDPNDDEPDINAPKGSAVLTSNQVSTSTSYSDPFPEVYFFNEVFGTQSGAFFWIVIDVGTSSTDNYWYWQVSQTSGYDFGIAKRTEGDWSGDVWIPVSGDFGFKTYHGGTPTKVKGGILAGWPNSFIAGDGRANLLESLWIGKAYYQAQNNIYAGGQDCTANPSPPNCNPGTTDPPPQPFPIPQATINEWTTLIDDYLPDYEGDITACPGGAIVLPAGKYIGNISLPQDCYVTVFSPVWIQGSLTLLGGDTLKLDAGNGSAAGVIIVDGNITLNSQFDPKKIDVLGSGALGSYLMLISNIDNKANPIGTRAIRIHSDSSEPASNVGALYTNLGHIELIGRNNAVQVTGWKLNLSQTYVVYDQGMASTLIQSGPSGSYSIIKGTYQIK